MFESFVKSISYKTMENYYGNQWRFESFVKSISYKTNNRADSRGDRLRALLNQ